jgi:hypothetical protein
VRLGCVGCLVVVVGVLIVVVAALGVIFLSTNIFSTPDVRPVAFTKTDGHTAQQRLFELLSRQSRRSSRRDPVVITEAEANAFLARHLEQAGLPLSPIMLRFSQGQFTAQGQTPLRNLFKGPPLSYVVPYITDRRFDQPVWVTVRGRVRVEGGSGDRHGEVDVAEFVLGRQPLGSFLLWVLLGPTGGGILKWPVPAVVDEIRIGDRQVSITTR